MQGLDSLKGDVLLLRIARELSSWCVEGWLVGGAVRDYLSGRPGLPDLDLVVLNDALGVGKRLAGSLGGTFVALDLERCICRVVVGKGEARRDIDLAGPRAYPLEEDLFKRDFTVNAMAVALEDLLRLEALDESIIDPAGGLEDLRAGLIRAPSPDVLDDDPIRLLRAFRIAAELGFSIEDKTRDAIASRAHGLGEVAGERIRFEVFRLFAVEPVWPWVVEMERVGILAHLVGEYIPMVGLDQGRHHESTLWDHSLASLRHLESLLQSLEVEFPKDAEDLRAYLGEHMEASVSCRSLTKWAVLWHDIGKPSTRTVDSNGEVRFLGHEHAGAEIVRALAGRLRMSRKSKVFLGRVVGNHLRLLHLSKAETVTKRACYRFFRDLKNAAPAVCLVALADARATREGGGLATDVEGVVKTVFAYRRARSVPPAPPLVSGKELMTRYGLSEGPLVGQLLSLLEEARASGEVATKEDAFAYLDTRRDDWATS